MRPTLVICLIAALPLGAQRVCAESDKEFISVARDESGVWWFRNTKDERFISLGVSDIPPGPSRELYDQANPGYAAFRYYNSTADWSQSVQKNLRRWGFNTIGAWGHPLLAEYDLPECRVLHWGQSLHVPWCDIFAEGFRAQIERFALRDVAPLKHETKLLGWFTDNELQWYADTIFHYHLHLNQSSATRQKLIELLKGHYENDFGALQADFSPAKATKFEELGQRGAVHLKGDGKGSAVISRFAYLVAEQYYRVVHDAIRKHDPHHLILGDRYMSYCPPEVAKAAGPYVDVISTNFDWPDWKTGQLPTHFLCMLHEQSGKPVLVTEWYVAAEENRSGNRNRGVSFTKVKTQDQRAATAERRLSVLLREPYVVGAHWFRYADEPTNGRLTDGEDFNFGLVDIHDQPYKKLVAAMKHANQQANDEHAASVTPHDSDTWQVSRYPPGSEFPENVELFSPVKSQGSSPLADLRLAWNEDQLFLGLVGFRFVDEQLFKNRRIPASYHQRMSLKLGDDSFELSFDPDANSSDQATQLSMIETRHRHLGVRFTYLVKIPFKEVQSISRFAQGTVVPLEITFRGPSGPSTRWKTSLVLEDVIKRLAERESAEPLLP